MRAWLWLVCASALAQSTLTAPSWLVPFPGAKADTRTMPSMIESTYQATATPAAVVSHYGKLFDSAGLSFAPTFDGMGTVVRSSPPECDLMIKIREQDGGSFVRVSCAVKTAAMVAVAAPPSASKTAATPRVIPPDPEAYSHDRAIAEMRKYDEPIQTRTRTTPIWPSWLRDPAGHVPNYRRPNGESTFLSASFAVAAEIAQVREMYLGLLQVNGCTITGQGKAWFESSCKADPKAVKQTIVRAEMSPAEGGATQVQLRVSSIP
jgi:hypothetical protein